MAYTKDPDAYTRGVGAIRARDGVASRGRARAQLERARTSRRIDRKRVGMMGLGDGLIAATASSGGGSSSTPIVPTVQLLNTMLNLGNQKIYSKGATAGPSLDVNAPIDQATVASLNAILASGLSPLLFIDARISPAWITANAGTIIQGLQQWLGYGASGNDLVLTTQQGPGKKVPPQTASWFTPPAPIVPPVIPTDTSTPPPSSTPPVTDPGGAVAVLPTPSFVASHKGLVLGGIALAAFLYFRRKRSA